MEKPLCLRKSSVQGCLSPQQALSGSRYLSVYCLSKTSKAFRAAMDKTHFVFPYSPWYILLCLLVGLVYAWLLYGKAHSWSKPLNYTLAALRFVCISLICFLLLAPLLSYIRNSIEKPSVVFAIDHSQSIAFAHDSAYLAKLQTSLETMADKLRQEGFETEFQYFSPEKAEAFTHPTTDLGLLLRQVQNNYENRNLDKVVLLSDGIHNQGLSPLYIEYNFPVVPVGLGDTTLKKDLKINALFFNKIAYLGNQFPIVAELQNIAFDDRNVRVSLLQGGQVIESKTVLSRKNSLQEVSFLATARQKGLQYYTVAVEALQGEQNLQNNQRDAFVEVIDGKEKILLMAFAPHPDLKALRSIIEKNENYSLEVHIIGIGTPKENRYDLVIAHQVPDLQNAGQALLNKYIAQNTPVWYILGAQSNVLTFQGNNKVLDIRARPGQNDQVLGQLNSQFSRFDIEADKAKILQRLPPMTVPYGEYRLKEQAEAVLWQQVGSVATKRPLLALSTGASPKSAVLAGEGLWQWRLEEYALTEQQEVVDGLVLKVIQYLSTKDDKRKLRVYTTNTEYYDFDKVVFEAEAYNDIYEKIYNLKLNLRIRNSEGKNFDYTLSLSEGNSRFEIPPLPKGIYRYTATAEILGRMEQSQGEFTVRELQLEALQSTADHELLRQLAQNTGGRFFKADALQSLEAYLIKEKKANALHSSQELEELIHLKWLFFLLMTLAAAEWVSRKYWGSY